MNPGPASHQPLDDSPEPASAGTPGLFVRLLGRFEVLWRGQPVIDDGWTHTKPRSLIKLLAVNGGAAIHREQAQEILWPRANPAHARLSLRQTIFQVRSRLAALAIVAPLVIAQGDVIGLAGGVSVDAVGFAEAAAEASFSEDPERHRHALSQYRGPLLPGDIYEEWTRAPRENVRERYVALLRNLGQLYLARGQPEEAAAACRQLLGEDPLDEEVHCLLMHAYVRSGQRHRALRQYDVCREVLADQLNTVPSRTTESLRSRILAGDSDDPSGRQAI